MSSELSTAKPDSLELKQSSADTRRVELCAHLKAMAERHPCSSHPFFDYLEKNELSNKQIASLLRNYDAHASVLRRFLLNAAAIMPEYAVPFVLENVRNEYGNGDYSQNHQDQLRDLAWSSGISRDEYFSCRINKGISNFLREAAKFYSPRRHELSRKFRPAAVVAGAISATEILAIKEFAFIQKPFFKRGLEHHIWFHHVFIEAEHTDESLALALCFMDEPGGLKSVEHGLNGVLNANLHLYDGLLASLDF